MLLCQVTLMTLFKENLKTEGVNVEFLCIFLCLCSMWQCSNSVRRIQENIAHKALKPLRNMLISFFHSV